jgi:DNA modification methylase
VSIQIRQGDAFNTDLDDDSIDLIVTSPPYYSFREYTDAADTDPLHLLGNEEHPWEYIKGLVDWGSECARVLKDSGSLFVVLGDKYAGSGGHNNAGIGADKKRGPGRYSQSAYVSWTLPPLQNKSQLGLPTRYANIMAEEGWVLRQTIIWDKPNSIPHNAKDRAEFTHEYIFHFTPRSQHYASPQLRSEANKDIYASSVWEITSSEGLTYPKEIFARLNTDTHYAAYPVELVRRIVTGWCPPNGVVLDPFGGSGTTALVAKVLGRDAISLDLSAGYTRLAKWRVFVSDHASKLKDRWGLV